MAIQIPTTLVEFILLGPLDDRRQLQDSPILGDVWVAFGSNPDKAIDLLIAPYRGHPAGFVAMQIDDGLDIQDDPAVGHDPANIAFLQGLIVAHLTFEQLMCVVAPKTKWWMSRKKVEPNTPYVQRTEPEPTATIHEAMSWTHEQLKSTFKDILDSAERWRMKTGNVEFPELPPLQRFLALIALIHWAGSYAAEPDRRRSVKSADEQIGYVLKSAIDDLDRMCQMLRDLLEKMYHDKTTLPLVWQVSLNRSAMPAIAKSVPAVKADAATYLFKVNCREITWAVIDSGIDGNHPAFKDRDGVKSRVKKSYDFKNFRRIVSISNRRESIRKANIDILMKANEFLLEPVNETTAHADLARLAEDAASRGSVHWELVEKYVRIDPGTEPPSNHGTHVAGIIGASKEAAQKAVDLALLKVAEEKAASGDKTQSDIANVQSESIETVVKKVVERVERKENPNFADGMCPDISLYDFRVLGASIQDAEFAIIAALQFIRYLNSKDNFLEIHGANLSLSIPHDVRNFACGRTPICDEAEKLVSSGVVVVAAAGNHGYKSFETKDGSHDSYTAFSITDPGNADSILTVGATHRFWPHTYGVSFFSSRGPTGDGRMKPDLVAPGERIRAPMPKNHDDGGNWGDLDGTSMAAPHVSGAAAMLMSRYSELVGQPLRIKRILCESATDLGRERSFQGHGMLDVLRAFQSI